MSDKNHISVQCVVGDIAQQPDVDAVINAANAQLRTGGGVAFALLGPSCLACIKCA